MEISKLIEEYKINKDEKILEDIIKHYEPIFIKNVNRRRNKDYTNEIKTLFPNIIEYYFKANLQSPLNSYLRGLARTIFNKSKNFDELIGSDEEENIKIYYVDKFYNRLIKECKTSVLNEKQLYELCMYDISVIFNNYIKANVQTKLGEYFNIIIYKRIETYKNEENLLLNYCYKIDITNDIKKYFYYKYCYLLDNFKDLSFQTYKKCVDEALKLKKRVLSNVFEGRLISEINKYRIEQKLLAHKEIENLKSGKKADIELIKKYYSYIKRYVFEKFEDKVTVKEELKKQIDIKYEDYFTAGINWVRNNKDGILQRYINTRLTDYIKNKSSLYNISYVDKDLIEYIESKLYLIDYYVDKYSVNCSKEYMYKILKEEYYKIAHRYFDFPRNSDFNEYVKNQLYMVAKTIKSNYTDDNLSETLDVNKII